MSTIKTSMILGGWVLHVLLTPLAMAGDVIVQSDTFFNSNEQVSAAVLSATTANNAIQFTVQDRAMVTGNNIDNRSFEGSLGVNAIVQNTAPSATVQQIVNVQLNGVELNEALAALDAPADVLNSLFGGANAATATASP